MKTQQPEALRLANILRGIDTRSRFANERLSSASDALENQHARITDLESQLAQRFDAADVATAAAQGFRDGVAYAALPRPYCYEFREPKERYTTEQMRAFADATCALRVESLAAAYRGELDKLSQRNYEMRLASHGQAPAGTTEPTEQQILEAAEKAGLWPNTVHSWIPAFHRYHKELAKAQPAPAQADSVQEDAADPLQGAANWLAEAHGQFSPVVLSGCLMIGYNRAKRLHDAALAARKQGASR